MDKNIPSAFEYFDETSHILRIKLKKKFKGNSISKVNIFKNNKKHHVHVYMEIYWFLNYLFYSVPLTGENIIAFLIYIDRIRLTTEFIFNWKTWRRCVLGAYIMLIKISEDKSIWNEDISNFMNYQPIPDLNILEQQTLKLIKYNLYIPSTLYSVYFLELKKLSDIYGLEDINPLNDDIIKKYLSKRYLYLLRRKIKDKEGSAKEISRCKTLSKIK
ncbi:hypothetical protein HZS_1996 [Henneguya salminicola]|nr:hypothetical protein HZS_1996 [Henneguya salminicola]